MRHILKNQSILAIQNRPGNQLTEAQIMELAINAEQVKVEPMDAENDGTLVQEINVDDYGGEGFLFIKYSLYKCIQKFLRTRLLISRWIYQNPLLSS